MKKAFLAIVVLIFTCLQSGSACAELDNFLFGLNGQAKADMSGFTVRLNTQFGIPLPQVHSIINKVKSPADAFMCLQLSFMSNKPLETVLLKYKNKGKNGWGAMAKELGVKPGSPEFHALKNGAFFLTGIPNKKTKGNSKKKAKNNKKKSKGKGHNK